MAGRVFLHVGAPKTGSTFVQNVLWRHREALLGWGVLLPGTRRGQDQAMTDLRQVAWRDPEATVTWDDLVAEANAWPGDVIVTNEGLGGATREQAERALRSFGDAEVHVIVVGRDLWRTLPSMWQESVRSRSLWSFGEFLTAIESGKHDAFWNHTANRMLRTWGDPVPAERRHFVTLPPAGAPKGLLWERFAGIIGLPELAVEDERDDANKSLGAAEIEMLRRLNHRLGARYPHRTPYRRGILLHLVNPVLKKAPNELKFGVGLDRAPWVLALAEQHIAELEEYPCQVVGDLAELRPAGMARHGSPDDLADSQVLDAAIETIIGLVGYADTLAKRAEHRDTDLLTRIKRRVAREVRR